MSYAGQPHAERQRIVFLAPLIIAGNALVFLSVAVLVIVGINGGESLGLIKLHADANRQIVRDYLAATVPGERYRIRQWFPATPLEEKRVPAAATQPASAAATERGFAQRVTLVFYGPSGARELDTIYWIQNGRVTRAAAAEDSGVAGWVSKGRGLL
jgi:hypothetical protein